MPKVGVSALLGKPREASIQLSLMMEPGSTATIREVLEHVRYTQLMVLDPRVLSYLEAGDRGLTADW